MHKRIGCCERTEAFIQLLYVNTIKKWTGMENIGLKIPEKEQIYVISFQIFFQILGFQTRGAAYLRVRLVRRCLRLRVLNFDKDDPL